MDTEQFKKEIIPFARKLFPMMKRIVGNDTEAEDAVQELMLKLWTKRKVLHNIENPRAYIITAAKNFCFDLVKKRRSKNLGEDETYKLVNITDSSGNYEEKEKLEVASKVINDLPDTYREVIRWREIDGFTFEELREMTGYEIPYLRVILSRARKKVRAEMLKIYNYEQGTNEKTNSKILQRKDNP